MNVDLVITADPEIWTRQASRLMFYAEEADIRLDAGAQIVNILGEEYGVKIKVPESHALRLADILFKASLIDVELNWKPVADDPAEEKIQSKLYRGGDTSMKPAEPRDRSKPATHPKYQDENHGETLKAQGRRTRYTE